MSKKHIINTIESLIAQKHCYMCTNFVRTSIPKDRGTCLLTKEYYPYKQCQMSCGGKHFSLGGNNYVIYNSLFYLKKA